MLPDNIENWREAGNISRTALEYGRDLIKPGAKMLDVLDMIEEKIAELGGKPAFPAQVSFNATAAHDCADPQDERTFSDQLCCLDVGVHVDGCIGDNALTIDLSGKHSDLVKASEDALAAAINVVKAGAALGEIGAAVQKTISDSGFAPVRNLSGHGLEPYVIHAHPSVPNFDSGDTTKLEAGQIIAIEPFATDGKGLIAEGQAANIFTLKQKKPLRNIFARQILKEIEKNDGLPFTTRWLTKKFPPFKVNVALREMNNAGMLETHPPLVEIAKGMVSQAEHTVLVTEDGCEILTKV